MKESSAGGKKKFQEKTMTVAGGRKESKTHFSEKE